MNLEEKVLRPSPGMCVIAGKVIRRVTFFEGGIVNYVATVKSGREVVRSVTLGGWQAWCKKNNAVEEIPF